MNYVGSADPSKLFPQLDLKNCDLNDDQIAQIRSQAPASSLSRLQHVAVIPHSPVLATLPTPPDAVHFVQLPSASEDDLPPSDNEGEFGPLTDPPKEQLMQKIYMGKSSFIGLVSDAIDMKAGRTGPNIFTSTGSDTSWQRPMYWSIPPVMQPSVILTVLLTSSQYETRIVHDEFHAALSNVELPPPDLLQTLIDAYFRDVNTYMPLLHRALFERQLAAGLHEVDPQFLVIVLLVCAIASRSIFDSRVLAEPGQLRSAGWRYYEMVAPLNRVQILENSQLFDLQAKVARNLGFIPAPAMLKHFLS